MDAGDKHVLELMCPACRFVSGNLPTRYQAAHVHEVAFYVILNFYTPTGSSLEIFSVFAVYDPKNQLEP